MNGAKILELPLPARLDDDPESDLRKYLIMIGGRFQVNSYPDDHTRASELIGACLLLAIETLEGARKKGKGDHF